MGHSKRRGTSQDNLQWEKFKGIECIQRFTCENIKDKLSRQIKIELQKEMADMKQWQVNHEDTVRILADIDNLKEENEDLRSWSRRSILIFRGVPEREQIDSWEDVSRHFSEYLANKLRMDLYKLDKQLSRAHRTPKSVYDNKCRAIFTQFLNWWYA